MKRIFAILIILLVLLAGCTTGGDNIENVDANNKSEVIPTTSTSESTNTQIAPKKEEVIDSEKIETTTKKGTIKNAENIKFAGIKPEDSSNNGYIASDGEFIYFWSGSSDDIGDGKLCRIKNEGTELKILSSDIPCSINVVRNKIYYISQKNQGDNYGSIYSIDKNGGNIGLLVDKDCDDLIVTEKYIYFINKTDGDSIYRANQSGGDLHVVVNQKISNLQYDNGFLYYETNNNQLFKMSTNSDSTPQKLMDNFYNYIVNGDNIYFLRDWFPYVYSISAKKERQLYKERVYGFTLGENVLYWLGYFNKTDEEREMFAYDIASVSLDGKIINVINSYNQNPNKRAPLYSFNGFVYYGIERHGEGDLELARIKSDGTGEEYLGDYLK